MIKCQYCGKDIFETMVDGKVCYCEMSDKEDITQHTCNKENRATVEATI